MMENKLLIYILDNKELKVLYTSDLENWHIEDIVLNNSFEFLSRKNLAFIKGKNNIDILYLSNDFKRDESGKFANDYLFASSNDGFKFVDTGQRCEYIGLSQFKFYNVNGNPIGMSREKFIKPSDDIYWKSILREYNDIRLQNDQEKYGDIIFDGNVFFKWYARKLYQSENANEWDEIHMSDNAKKLFEARAGNYQIIKADDIYMFRYKAADLNRDRIPNIDQYDKVYIFDKNMELISEHSFGKFVSNISYCDNVYFAETDKNYYSLDGLTWNEYDKTSRIPITNGHSVASFGERIEVSRTVFNGNFDTVVYETIKPDNPKNYADLFAYTLYDADNSQMSVFVSKDAIYWEEIKLPEETAQVQEMYHKDGKLVVEFREWLYEISYDEIHRNMSSQTSYVMVNNHILGFDTRPVIENDRTLVPMRFLFEALGADVDWDAVTRSAIVQSGDTVIRFSIDDTSVQINDKIRTMDVPARLIDSKTLVPLRFLSEELGYTVEWDESTRTATVSK